MISKKKAERYFDMIYLKYGGKIVGDREYLLERSASYAKAKIEYNKLNVNTAISGVAMLLAAFSAIMSYFASRYATFSVRFCLLHRCDCYHDWLGGTYNLYFA